MTDWFSGDGARKGHDLACEQAEREREQAAADSGGGGGDDVDPIVVAGDDGEVLDETEDGAIACVADGDGITIEVDPDTELGEQLAWHAGHRGESPEEFLDEAIREFLDADWERADGGNDVTIQCPNCGHEFTRDEAAAATFDGDEARYRCPECGHATEGPPPG